MKKDRNNLERTNNVLAYVCCAIVSQQSSCFCERCIDPSPLHTLSLTEHCLVLLPLFLIVFRAFHMLHRHHHRRRCFLSNNCRLFWHVRFDTWCCCSMLQEVLKVGSFGYLLLDFIRCCTLCNTVAHSTNSKELCYLPGPHRQQKHIIALTWNM